MYQLQLSVTWLRTFWSPKEGLGLQERVHLGRSESVSRSLKDLEISPRAWFRVSHLQLQGDYEKKRNGGQRKLRKRDAGNCSRSH